MAVQPLRADGTAVHDADNPLAAVAATFEATAAPTSGTDGIRSGFTRVRTLVTFAGAVTACNLRLWVRNRATGDWFKAASTDDAAALVPGAAASRHARDWEVGVDNEIFFQVESIAPGTSGNTVAVAVMGVA